MRSLKSSLKNGASAALQSTVPASTASRTFPRGGSGGMPKTLTVVLCEDVLYKTDGSNTTFVADVYDVDDIRELGPMIKGIRAHYVCDGATTNFSAKVTTQWSVLGKNWSTTTDILSAQTGTQTGLISLWLANDAVFGLLMRYAIEVKNSAGTAIESGRVTVILEIELKS